MGTSSDAEELLRQIRLVDAEVAALEAAGESQRRCTRQMHAPIIHMRQQRAARSGRVGAATASAAAAERQLFHAQLFVQPAAAAAASSSSAQLQSGVCVATANAAAAPAFAYTTSASASASASTSLVGGWAVPAAPSSSSFGGADLGAGPATLHVLLSNQSAESVEVDPQWTRLVVQLRVRPHVASSDGSSGVASSSETELQTNFPSARWAPRSSFQTALPIHSALFAHAHVNVRVLLRIRRPEYACVTIEAADAASGFVDLVLAEWTLDALDLCSPVLQPTPQVAPMSAKRRRTDRDVADNGAVTHAESGDGDQSPAKHARPGSINQLHRQALLSAAGEEARFATLPQVQLFGSVYSTPAWFAQHLPSFASTPSLSSMRGLLAPASFQIAFVVPLLLDHQSGRASGPVIHHFARMLMCFLLPAHSLAFPESTLDALLTPPIAAATAAGEEQGRPQQQQTPAAQARSAAAASSTTSTVRFRVRGPGLGLHGAEWVMQLKNGPSPAPVLVMLLVRAPSALALPVLRSSLLQRLHRMLFQSSPPHSYSGAGWSAVSMRRPATLAGVGGPAQSPSPVMKDARKWCIAYIGAHSDTAPSGFSGASALATAAVGTFHSQRHPAPQPPQPPLFTHVQMLRANLDDAAQRLRVLQLQHSPDHPAPPAPSSSVLASIFDLYLRSRALPASGAAVGPQSTLTSAGASDSDFAHAASSCLGSLHTLVC